MDYLTRLCEFAANLTFSGLPAETISRAREVTADIMAVIAAGSREQEIKKLTGRLTSGQKKNNGPATLLGDGSRTDTLTAALINGAAGTFLELDEGNQFARGHPAIHVFPAVLAEAEACKASGRDLILALVLGYDVGARIGLASKIRMSMHPHGTWGTVGAAVAVGKLNGYEAGDMRQIINVSSSLALATSRKTMLEGGTVRNVYSGVSNHMGILAHHLVSSGFTGEADGLGTVYGSVISDSFDPGALVEDLGRRFEISRNYFKRHACCRYNHSTLDALEILAGDFTAGRIPADQVAGVEVETYSLAAQLADKAPNNMLAAKFSIPFAVATYLTHGRTDVDCFRPDKVIDPNIRALAQMVLVREDPDLTAMVPARRPARVKVRLKDGTMRQAETYLNRGDFEDPYRAEDLEDKYYDLSVPVWGRDRAERIFEKIKNLDGLVDTGELTAEIGHKEEGH